MNSHAGTLVALLTPAMRVDGTSTLVRIDPGPLIVEAASECVEPIGPWHDCPSPSADVRGAWSFARGQRIPGTVDTFGMARCFRCGVRRDVVLRQDGSVLAGPEYRGVGDRER